MRLNKPLVFSLLAVVVSLIIVNLIGKEAAILVGNLGYTPITIMLASLTMIVVIKFRAKSTHGIAWIMFLACTLSWMIAEHMWIVEELVLHVKPFPSIADIFYVMGYVFLILFTIYHMRVVKDAITKKMNYFLLYLLSRY